MRIIGEIPHPELKISIFKMAERISVKFENAQYEQTFKLGTDDRFQTVEGVQQWADEALIAQVMANFRQMHAARMAATQRAFPPVEEEVFEEII
jgi:hypothetical protein